MRVRYQIVSIYRIKNGKIAEYWGIQDELSLRRQLGQQGRKYVLNKTPQETVEIKILRDNQPMTFQITLGEMPQFAP